MERKRYAIFSAQFLPHIGGVEFYTDNLARELARRGHEVVVVASAMPDAPEYEVTESGVEVSRLSAYWRAYARAAPQRLLSPPAE